MNIQKYVAAVAFLTVLSNSPAVFGQTMSCYPLPPGATSLPPGTILPPGMVLCPVDPVLTVVAPVIAPAPAPTPAVATPSQVTTAATSFDGYVDEDHEGRGKKNGMDNGKKNGLYKDHKDQNDKNDHLVMAGTISGNTLSVTAITSGHLEIGTTLSGYGIPQPVKIVAFGTGKGGVGTYTITTK